MTFRRADFYDNLRSMAPGGRLRTAQVERIEPILDLLVRSPPHTHGVPASVLPETLPRMAYILATAIHESAWFRHYRELGRGRGRAYGESLRLIGSRAPETARYYGRGAVQVTWLANYARLTARMSAVLGTGTDYVNDPGLLTRPVHAARALVLGMMDGLYTGIGLRQVLASNLHAPPTPLPYVNARRVVNGLDRAEHIAGIAFDVQAAFMDASRPAAPPPGV